MRVRLVSRDCLICAWGDNVEPPHRVLKRTQSRVNNKSHLPAPFSLFFCVTSAAEPAKQLWHSRFLSPRGWLWILWGQERFWGSYRTPPFTSRSGFSIKLKGDESRTLFPAVDHVPAAGHFWGKVSGLQTAAGLNRPPRLHAIHSSAGICANISPTRCTKKQQAASFIKLNKQNWDEYKTRTAFMTCVYAHRAVRFGNDNNASALGLKSELFLAFVPNLFVSWANWANVLVGRSAFMGTAPGDINNPSSFKSWFAQLEASVRRATSAKCGEMAHAPIEVSPRHLENSLGDFFKQYHRVEQQFKPFRWHRNINSP